MSRSIHRFDDIVDFFDHMRIPVSTMEREKIQGEYPYYGAQGIIDYVNDFIFDGEYVLIAEDGANLITRNQPIAQIAKGRFWVNNHAHIVRAKEGISTNYFVNILINSMNLTGYVTGAAQPKLSQKNLRIVEVTLPSYPEQQLIASILSAYDDLIENNRRRIQLLEQAARLLYKEWFVHLRFPGHEHVKITDGVPEGWVKGTVLNLGQIVTGKTPSTKIPENFGGDVPFVKTPDMHRSRIIIETEESLSERGVATQSNKTLPVGTILVASIGAKLGVVSITSSLCQTNQQINAVIPRKDYMRHYSLFALTDLKPLLEAMGGGATMPNVNKTKFSSIPLVIPPPILLREFEGFVKTSFQQMQILHEQVSRLTRARDLLLPRLINGEVTV